MKNAEGYRDEPWGGSNDGNNANLVSLHEADEGGEEHRRLCGFWVLSKVLHHGAVRLLGNGNTRLVVNDAVYSIWS